MLSQCPLVRWASGHWHYKRTLYSRQPLAKKGLEFLSIYIVYARLPSSLLSWDQCKTLEMVELGREKMSPKLLGERGMGKLRQLVQLNRLSLRNNQLKFKIAGKLRIIFEEFIEYTPIYQSFYENRKENRRMWTCNRLDLQTLGSQPVMPKNLPNHWWGSSPWEFVPFWCARDSIFLWGVTFRWFCWGVNVANSFNGFP